ncbi:unnamed protein product [Lepidochelys olivacea]
MNGLLYYESPYLGELRSLKALTECALVERLEGAESVAPVELNLITTPFIGAAAKFKLCTEASGPNRQMDLHKEEKSL